MLRHARPALSLLLLLAALLTAPLAAQSGLDEMLGGIRAYLLKQPVLSKALPAHPLLLVADRCDPARPKETLVLLSYRKLNCKDYPGVRVIAPRLILATLDGLSLQHSVDPIPPEEEGELLRALEATSLALFEI